MICHDDVSGGVLQLDDLESERGAREVGAPDGLPIRLRLRSATATAGRPAYGEDRWRWSTTDIPLRMVGLTPVVTAGEGGRIPVPMVRVPSADWSEPRIATRAGDCEAWHVIDLHAAHRRRVHGYAPRDALAGAA
jgi:hypothetical protein